MTGWSFPLPFNAAPWLLWVNCSCGKLIFRIWASICEGLHCSECRHAFCVCVCVCLQRRGVFPMGRYRVCLTGIRAAVLSAVNFLFFLFFFLRHIQITVIPPGFWKCQLTLFSPPSQSPIACFSEAQFSIVVHAMHISTGNILPA